MADTRPLTMDERVKFREWWDTFASGDKRVDWARGFNVASTDNELYQYWVSLGRPSPPEELSEVEQAIADASSLGELESVLQDAIEGGYLSKSEADDYRDKYYPAVSGLSQEAYNYLKASPSKNDLADRVLKLNLDPAMSNSIYESMLPGVGAGQIAMGGATSRYQTEQAQLKTDKQARAVDLTNAMNTLAQNQYLTPQERQEVDTVIREEGQTFIEGQSNSLANRLQAIATMGGLREQKAREAAPREEQQANALLGRNIAGGGTFDAWRYIKNEPQMPTLDKVINPYLESTGLGEGTRLKSFIESQIPGVVSDTQAERAAWWQRMQPQPEETEDTDDVGRLQSEADYWGRVAGNAPTSEYTSNTYWGTGGLAAIAQDAYQSAQGKLAALQDTPSTPAWQAQKSAALAAYQPPEKPPEVDPLWKALREKDWWSEYNLQPGSGTVSRLTPSVRY